MGKMRPADLLSDGCEEVDEQKEDAYKVVIGVSLVFSVGALLGICLVVPAMYSYVQNVSLYANADLGYCDTTTADMEVKIASTGEKIRLSQNRTKRSAGYPGGQGGRGQGGVGGPFAAAGAGAGSLGVGFQECPACCKPGFRGPPGDFGLPGLHGGPGPNGAPGRAGRTPNASCIPDRIFEPPPCLPCPQGPRGQRGHPGFPGEMGDYGIKGAPGKNGDPGERGPPGDSGDQGEPGNPGESGDQGLSPEAHVIPGPPGPPGNPGAWGLPGHKGQTGEGGYGGTPGERGWPGAPGGPGEPGPRGPDGPGGESGPPGTPGTCVCQETEVVVQDKALGDAAPRQDYPTRRVGYLRAVRPDSRNTVVGAPQAGKLKGPSKGSPHESQSGVTPAEVKSLSGSQVDRINRNGGQ